MAFGLEFIYFHLIHKLLISRADIGIPPGSALTLKVFNEILTFGFGISKLFNLIKILYSFTGQDFIKIY